MPNLREDVIKISYEVDKKQLEKVNDDIDKMAESAQKFSGSGGLGKISNGFERLTKAAKDFAKTHIDIKKVADTLKKSLVSAASAAYKGLKKVASVSFKALSVSLGAAATAVGYLVKQSVSAYANTEQLVGGIETLFGARGRTIEEYASDVGKSVGDAQAEYDKLMSAQSTMLANANDAFKSAGLSANEYMDTVTSFSASLISSVGGDTKQAADLANMAIIDIADNANKMGTSMESVQDTYKSLARGQYMMLDNLKLGYAGTKEGATKLVNDAAKLDKSIDANSLSFANIVKSIHAVQDEMGILGTTHEEAEGTITGSLNMVRSAWKNLMPALIEGGDSFDQCIDNLVYSAQVFGKNIMPAIKKALSGVGRLIEELAPIIAEEFPKLVDDLLPPLLDAAVSLVQGLIHCLPFYQS